MDFQRCRPTEYAYAVFDHVNDARMWKTFKTVYGATNVVASEDNRGEVNTGDPAIVMILNTQDNHTYDGYTFGCYSQNQHGKMMQDVCQNGNGTSSNSY